MNIPSKVKDFIAGQTLLDMCLIVGSWRIVSSTQRTKKCLWTYVVASKVVNVGLGKHGVVLELTLAERRGIASDDDELGFP